ncbi:MAG: hypothetical protein NVV82_22525 [Sporocytophaga sp.]|nr:hypothetical protein [Sporocytophaga sp.]
MPEWQKLTLGGNFLRNEGASSKGISIYLPFSAKAFSTSSSSHKDSFRTPDASKVLLE